MPIHTILRSVALSTLATACVVGDGDDPASEPQDDVVTIAAPKPRNGFISVCDLDHRNSDDPIVYPRMPGVSHRHSFYGNKTTNAFSTYDNMRPAGTSCRFDGDTAAYWMPTATRNGQPLETMGARFYYRRGRLAGHIEAYPRDLRMIAGNGKATTPQSREIVSWGCTKNEGTRYFSPQDCPGDDVRATVVFPNCWDGVHKDSPDHKSHMAYDIDGVCPATHPHQMPHLFLDFQFKTENGNGIQLSSDMNGMPRGSSLHADFWNTWDQDKLEAKITKCLDTDAACDEL
jgi:hypothetical protein